ncbi:hypothetical protein AB0L62_12910 [Nocardia asteroides]|uniref:hypothetical protein n=1 Tax=Nocardia asteroides TaxID=1824 RepID=UPI00344706E1
MDPTIVASAVAAGATALSTGVVAGLSDAAKLAVTDAYQGLKAVITRKYSTVDIDVVEARPQVPARQNVLAAELAEAGAATDDELELAAQRLWLAIHQHVPQVADVVGVKLTRVKAGELEIGKVTATGASGVIAEEVVVDGAFRIGDVTATQAPPHPPQARP